MKRVRQMEMAELMVATNNFSVSYARAVLIATPEDQLVEKAQTRCGPQRGRAPQHGTGDGESPSEHEGVVANGYVLRLLENDQVAEYLQEEHKDLCGQLLHLTESIAADTGTASQTVA